MAKLLVRPLKRGLPRRADPTISTSPAGDILEAALTDYQGRPGADHPRPAPHPGGRQPHRRGPRRQGHLLRRRLRLLSVPAGRPPRWGRPTGKAARSPSQPQVQARTQTGASPSGAPQGGRPGTSGGEGPAGLARSHRAGAREGGRGNEGGLGAAGRSRRLRLGGPTSRALVRRLRDQDEAGSRHLEAKWEEAAGLLEAQGASV